MKDVKVLIDEEDYLKCKDALKVMESIGKHFVSENISKYTFDSDKIGLVKIKKLYLQDILNDYFGLYDIFIK